MRMLALPVMLAALPLATAFIALGVARGRDSLDSPIIDREPQGDLVVVCMPVVLKQ